MKKLIIAGMVFLSLSLTGCDNYSAKQFGGTMTVELPKGQKLVNATWKNDADLWYLTKPMTEKDVAETYEFIEDSTLGIAEGKVIFKESK